jgi:hypothetical protein
MAEVIIVFIIIGSLAFIVFLCRLTFGSPTKVYAKK